MSHVVLLGDSIFDNAAYVPGRPAVIAQLEAALPSGWCATLLAVDGHVAAGVHGQLSRLPPDATHLAISAGGNDALACASILGQPATNVAEVVREFADIQDDFRREYRAMLEAVLAWRPPHPRPLSHEGRGEEVALTQEAALTPALSQGEREKDERPPERHGGPERHRGRSLRDEPLPTVVCTIYDAIPDLPREAMAALAFFNDVITREASRAGVPVLDLRVLCRDNADYSPLSPIEPSAIGGAKIAEALARFFTTHDFSRRECVVFW